MGSGRVAPFVLVLLTVCTIGTGCSSRWKGPSPKREPYYQATLRPYAEALEPGMSRKEVEAYLRAKDVRFSWTCCIDESTAYETVILIERTEDRPWYCNYLAVYVAFEFEAVEPQEKPSLADTDRLLKVSVFKRLEECL